MTAAYHVLVKAPYDALKGGEIEKTARNLTGHLAQSGEFAFSGLESASRGLIGKCRELLALRQDVMKAGCVWLHDGNHLTAIMAYLFAREYRKPLVITQHTDIDPGISPVKRLLGRMIDRLITRRILRLADQVIFSSDAVAEYYYHEINFTKPVQIIPNGVDLDAFKPVAPEQRTILRHRFALKDDQPVVISAGRFSNSSDMQIIHHLAQLLPDWRFWLIGNGRFKPEKWFLPNVQVFRGRNRASRASLYQTADLMIAPTATSRYPTGFQEALACGIPVLCSPVTAEGSHFAKPHIQTENVDPRAPEETAWLWAETLKTRRSEFPQARCRDELASIAQLFWDQDKISSYYADILRTTSQPAMRGIRRPPPAKAS